MNLHKEIEINKHQPCEGRKGTDIGDFFNLLVMECESHGRRVENNVYFLLSQAYTYGVIQGKRAERAKKSRIV